MNLKKPVILALLAFALSQCVKEEPAVSEQDQVFKASELETRKIAEHYFAWQSESNAAEIKTVSDPTVFSDAENNPVFYAFNYQEGGFVIISADKRSIPVLAFSDRGTPDWTAARKVNGLALWLNQTTERITDIRAKIATPDFTIQKEWDKFSSFATLEEERTTQRQLAGARNSTIVPPTCTSSNCVSSSNIWGPLFSTTYSWGQSGVTNWLLPANDCDCGRSYAGCGPVAIAQVLRYHSPNTNFNYSAMPANSVNTCTATTAGQQSLANLIVSAIAHSQSVMGQVLPYGGNDCFTLTLPSKIPDALSALGLSGGSTQSVTSGKMVTELSSGNPVIMYGHDNIFTEWHIWVCDGVRRNYVRYCDGNTCTYYETMSLYLNWGWDGSYNGWFAYGNYAPGNGDNFSGSLGMVAGIRGNAE